MDGWAAIMEHMKKVKALIGPECYRAQDYYLNCPQYPLDKLVELYKLQRYMQEEAPEEEIPAKKAEFIAMMDALEKIPNAPEPIMLWPEGAMPAKTEYTENPGYIYSHGPDFAPFMYEVLLPEDVTPKGAVVVCAGGDHASNVLNEGYQICLDMNERGYQAFFLCNRPNHNPWCEQECGVDASRAIRYVRANAEKYRIPADQVAFAGFSNGGLTGEACIQYYSGEQTVKDQFPGYEPDELDQYYGAPDVNICVYGPRFNGAPFNWDKVVYPPTFFAVGREDTAMDNLNYVYPDLVAHKIPVEMHTYAATPHGVAGIKLIHGQVNYPLFETWNDLVDAFMQDVYNKRK